MGATVRNGSVYIERLKMTEEREKMAKAVIGKMTIEQLSEMVGFYRKMGQMCSEAMERKLRAHHES
nr:putative glutamine amidotransferase PB2B2.05 [Ipomoea batatas]